MKRTYYKWFSHHLQKDMEMLVFGHTGTRVLFFPTRSARFYDYEDWRVIDAIKDKIEAGIFQVYCVDSVDAESLYNTSCTPRERIERHLQYEQYIVKEVLPFSREINPNINMISAGCSLGAYHAMNIGMKYPQYFNKILSMSGRYDLTHEVGYFRDLFDGYHDQDIYYNNPVQFLPNLQDEPILEQLRRLDIIMVIGQDDAFLENNKHFSKILSHKGIKHQLFIWHEEAHKARYWRKMIQLYL